MLTPLLLLTSLLLQAAAPTPPATPPAGQQTAKIQAGLLSVPITVREQYLGKSGDKTVVRFTFQVSKGDLRGASNAAPRVVSFFIVGDVRDSAGKWLESFRVPLDVDMSDVDVAKPLRATFLRPLPIGALALQFRLEGIAGKAVGLTDVKLTVPAMQSEFKAEDAGTDAAGLPTAAAVILESENREVVPKESGQVKILAPTKEVPVGLIRIEVEVKPPVQRVEFFLEDKKILVRNRAPYTVELDLGTIPKKQTLKALGFDKLGNFVDADAWAINEREARLAVRILELPRKPEARDVELKVAVQSIAGGVARTLKLYLDDKVVKEWSQPPYTVSVPAADIAKATLLRATALDDEGKEFSDIKLMKGDQRFMSKMEVNLVELNVSVFDSEARFQKGLKKEDFTVLEDGVKEEIASFELAESQPLSMGVVIDGSGSMKDSMSLVHQAASEFIRRLIGEKDQGFVMEFREQPILLASMTKKVGDLIRAVTETRAVGATALHDSVVMGLYQFRAIAGKKALVILTDGKDNHSWTDYDTLRRYSRSARVPVFFIGLDISILDVGLKGKLKELGNDTGGDTFFVKKAAELPEVYKKIETELRSQYFLSYLSDSKKGDQEFRTVEVKLKDPKLRAKTIRGYFP